MFIDSFFNRFVLPEDLKEAVSKCRWRCYPETKEQLLELCYGPTHSSIYDVTYTIPGKGSTFGFWIPLIPAEQAEVSPYEKTVFLNPRMLESKEEAPAEPTAAESEDDIADLMKYCEQKLSE